MKKIIITLGILLTTLNLSYAQSNLSLGGTGWATSTIGDLFVGTSSKIRYTRLPIGSTGNVLWVLNGQPAWVATSSLGITGSGTVTSVSAINNATGLTISSTTCSTVCLLTFALTSGFNIPLTASTTEWTTAFASTTNITPSWIRTLFSNTVTGLTYTSGTGVTSLTVGYNIPLTASTTNWNSFFDTPSTRITAGTNLSWAGNTLNASGGGSGNSAWTIGNKVIYNATSTDNVGVGTTTPSSILSVASSSANLTSRLFSIGTTTDIFTIFANGSVNLPQIANTFLSTDASGKIVATTTSQFASSTWVTSTFVPYTGATGNVNLGSNNLFTTGILTSTSSVFTNSTSTGNLNVGGFFNFVNATGTGLTLTDLFSTRGFFTNASSTNLTLTGAFHDSVLRLGALGEVLQATGTSTRWVATSTLGITGGASLSGGTPGRVTTWLTTTTVGAGILQDNGTVAGINATNTTTTFNIQGLNGATNPFAVASSTGTGMFNILSNGNIGIATSTPTNLFSVANSTGNVLTVDGTSAGLTDFLFSVATTSPNYFFGVQGNGHWTASSTLPTLSSCGTNPSITGSGDTAFTVTVGSVSATTCTATFANAFTNTPVCTVSSQTGTITVGYTKTNTAIIMTNAALTSDVIDVICIGQRE